MSDELKYQTWQANRSICRSLHQFSEKLPGKLREEYLAMLDGIVAEQKSLVADQNRKQRGFSSRGRSFLHPLMLYFGLRK